MEKQRKILEWHRSNTMSALWLFFRHVWRNFSLFNSRNLSKIENFRKNLKKLFQKMENFLKLSKNLGKKIENFEGKKKFKKFKRIKRIPTKFVRKSKIFEKIWKKISKNSSKNEIFWFSGFLKFSQKFPRQHYAWLLLEFVDRENVNFLQWDPCTTLTIQLEAGFQYIGKFRQKIENIRKKQKKSKKNQNVKKNKKNKKKSKKNRKN